MSKIVYVLGNYSITVFHKGRPVTISKTAKTFNTVLAAVKANDAEALDRAVNIKETIFTDLKKNTELRIENDSIFFGDREINGLITSRIFEMLDLGLDTKPISAFLKNLLTNPSKRAVDELFGFLEVCELPITEDGHFLAYKKVRSDYKDVYSGTMDNSVGQILEMSRNLVDEDKNRTCSAGLHFCSYDYLQSFSGERIVVLKINPADVVAIPADYNNTKGRTCRYEVVSEIELTDGGTEDVLTTSYMVKQKQEDKPIEFKSPKYSQHQINKVVNALKLTPALSDSRISYLTGVNRRSVSRIRDRFIK